MVAAGRLSRSDDYRAYQLHEGRREQPAIVHTPTVRPQQWRNFADGQRNGIEAKIEAFWTDATNWGGVTNFRWQKPGDEMTFRMKVQVPRGDPDKVIAEVWTNSNHSHDPESYYAVRMNGRRNGNQLEFDASIPIHNIGNYRAVGRISTDGGNSWTWMNDFGKADLRFRVKYTGHEAINEKIVHVGMANARPEDWKFSTFQDLTDGKHGDYNLEALRDQGVNAIRIQPPFRSDPWDRRHPYDTAGSPYAATDFFAIDPRTSRDCHQRGLALDHWDKDEAMRVANAEFKRFVDKAHSMGIQVILDIALNHGGHNFTFRDYFADRAVGDRVMRDNFSKIAVNPEQLRVIEDNVRRLGGGASAEEKCPWMFASKDWNENGANSVFDMLAGGNGEWQDTKQFNHGAFNWGSIEKHSRMNENVVDWQGRILEYWVREMGVDGFRLDHSSNLPTNFWERALNKMHANAGRPIAILGEDFNQNDKLRPYVDALEAGWYHGTMNAFKGLDVGSLRHIMQNDHFSEAHRTGNHDEERVIHAFGGDVMASTRYQATMQLMGGWYISLFADEYIEGKKFEFKHTGAVPPVLWALRNGSLPDVNINARRWIGQAGHMKTHVDALRTARREWLEPRGRGYNDIVPVARHADASDQTVLLFSNLSNNGKRANSFNLDHVTRGRIDPNAWYNVKDLMGHDWGQSRVWAHAKKGDDLLNNGVYVELNPYQIQALLLERVG